MNAGERAELREKAEKATYSGGEEQELADAVLALLDVRDEQERFIAQIQGYRNDLQDRVAQLQRELDEALAVIELAKYLLIYDTPGDIYDDAHVSDALDIISAAPTDALRERDAEKWGEGFDRGFYSGQVMPGADASESPVQNPYEEGVS